MVLETRLALLLTMSALFATACAAASPTVTDSATVLGTELKILTVGEQCILQTNSDGANEKLKLQPAPPCFFSRRDEGSPQSFNYPEQGIESTLIILGSPLGEEDRERWEVNEADHCGKASQGIIVRHGKIEISKKPVLHGVRCKDQGVDEKDFWYFAH